MKLGMKVVHLRLAILETKAAISPYDYDENLGQ